MIPDREFKTVVEHTPLVSLDFIVKYQDNILLGKRKNKPALGYYFTTGGIIRKNETLQIAMKRLAEVELGIELQQEPKFIGVFEHFYEDSIFEDVSTHYVNLGYMLELTQEPKTLPKEQHTDYRWFELNELLQSDEVHKYVKNYFKEGN
ncbi:GDP-mannose mannosyl hydrolase [Sulfurimonas aquatica]|uniref:GDP-mannose mannosyl hydrolase n=1 Tax=Sulfurimonas aquatica TaxID=2672570 RepID=A0A975B192_9BACT|nr:GDP-mannose mannosyl hydrolase [Sulfurimonas aquatica]QSZ42357.1 GDP-mannose mannosyl hydrolase [Sulfurimonas aquatica]